MFNEEAYLNRRIKNWQRLDELLNNGGGRLWRASGAELVETIRLYRQAAGDLAYLSTHSSNADVVSYLNNLVGRAYMEIYRHGTVDPAAAFIGFLSRAARTVRTYRKYIFLSYGIVLSGAMFAFLIMSLFPATRPFFVSPSDERLHAMWMSGAFEARSGGTDLGMAAGYAQHNPMVAIRANGAALASFGLLTVFIDWINGVSVGSLAADMNSVGRIGHLLSSIFPHGVSELGGFGVTGGASYLLATALFRPGQRTRGEALRRVGPDCAVLCIVSLVMILCAAPVEGFLSFNPGVPVFAKIVVGCLALTAWLSFFIGFGRNDPPIPHALTPSSRD